LSPRQAALRLGVRTSKVFAWIHSGELLAANLGDCKTPRFKISPQALEQFLARRSVVPPAKPARKRRQASEVIQFF
jgi:excisionase family DNA binding protein